MTRHASVKVSTRHWWELTVVLLLMGMGTRSVRRSRHSSAGPDVAQPPPTVGKKPHPWRKWWVLTGALMLVGTACVGFGLHQSQHPLAGPVKAQRVSKASATKALPAPVKANPIAPIAERSMPTELQIPAIGLAVSLSTLGLNLDGSVQVPTDIQQPGWFRLGPSPGQIGSAVILGHVDSYQGPAVFFKLRSLVAGDLIDVNLVDGSTAEFDVTSVVMYLKSNFPDQAVYGSHGFSQLQLVTCAGAFDTQTGHYLSNIVVYSSLVALISKAQTLPSSGNSGV